MVHQAFMIYSTNKPTEIILCSVRLLFEIIISNFCINPLVGFFIFVNKQKIMFQVKKILYADQNDSLVVR